MSNIVRFPTGHVPPLPPPVKNLADQLDAAELALLRAQTAQLKAMTREANAAWLATCFRKLVFWLFVAWLLHALMSPAGAEPWQSRSYYDGQGRFAGSSLKRGNQTTFYGANGGFAGSEIRRGKWRSFYGPRGNFTGSSINRR